MIKILNTNIANAGIYYGQDLDGNKTYENLDKKSLTKLAKKYKSIPVTLEHDTDNVLGYLDNFHMQNDMLLGDLTLYEDDTDVCLNKYISPEFVITDDGKPIQMIAASVVEEPAISDNLKILTDEYVINAKKKMPYRAQKVQIIQTKDNSACKFCKKIADQTRNKPITWEKAKAMLPLHLNCRCSIKKM